MRRTLFKALASDPWTKLDVQLATPETQKTFNDLGGAGGAAAAAQPLAAPAAAADDGAGDKGGLKCTPDVRELQTLRPIPLECTSDEEVGGMEIRYKSFGSEEWHSVKMKKVGDAFRGEVPCEATSVAGTLKLYVRAKDASGETVDSFGSKAKPVEFMSSENTTATPRATPVKRHPTVVSQKKNARRTFRGVRTVPRAATKRGASLVKTPTSARSAWSAAARARVSRLRPARPTPITNRESASTTSAPWPKATRQWADTRRTG